MATTFFFVGLLAILAVLGVAISRLARWTVLWGVILGVVIGFWVVAPFAVRSHHLHPQGLREWVRVQWILALFFGGLCGALTAMSAWILAAYDLATGGGNRFKILLSFVWSATVVPVSYLLLSEGLEYVSFGRLPSFREFSPWAVRAGFLGLAATALLSVAVRRSNRLETDWRPLPILGSACMLFALASAALVVRTPRQSAHALEDHL